jgi:hypothetical protein
MTITELQKKLQEMYKECGDIEVVAKTETMVVITEVKEILKV